VQETSSDRGNWPPLILSVGVITVVVGADLITWLIFAVSCPTGENSPEVWNDFCSGGGQWLPLLGACLTIAGGVYARARRNVWPLAIGAALGSGIALALWGLMGDPAGHFTGLLTD
jgi:hypothetical protein